VRYEGRADIYEAFLHLACALDCLCCAQARSRDAEQVAMVLFAPA
jgi:hypothetical protein